MSTTPLYLTLLRAAVRFIDGDRSTAPAAAFAAALLTREAVEVAITIWGRQALDVDLARASGRARLAVLEEHAHDRAVASRTAYLWNTLSAMLHHGPGTVDPGMVRRLIEDVQQAIGDLGADVRRHRERAGRQNAASAEKERR